MIDRREDPEDKAQWREPANRQPKEVNPHAIVENELCYILGKLELKGIDDREEALQIIGETLFQRIAERNTSDRSQPVLLRLIHEAVCRLFESVGMEPSYAALSADTVRDNVEDTAEMYGGD
jgi:hypothetical protein